MHNAKHECRHLFYHAILRGVNKQQILEYDYDYIRFYLYFTETIS